MNRTKIARQLLSIAKDLMSARSKTAGYTHYWKMSRPFESGEWGKIVNGAKKIVKRAEADGIAIAGPSGTGSPKFSPAIALNGTDENGESHETFFLTKDATNFDFTKTAEKPYDAVVVSILALAKKVAPDAFEPSSDGGDGVFSRPPYKASISRTSREDGSFDEEEEKNYNLGAMDLSEIASLISRDWGRKVNYAAKPYLEAMFSLRDIDSSYGYDTGRSVVTYFLSNSGSYRGPLAKDIKKELKKRLK